MKGLILNKKVALFLMTEKGLHVLRRIIEEFPLHIISEVVVARDRAVQNDFVDEIVALCQKNYIRCSDEIPKTNDNVICIAVSWRTLISITDGRKLIVFHDSLLPRYRGFNPLVTALLNGDREIGATALWACDKYDRGKVITQKSSAIDYPITVQSAIQRICSLYEEMSVEIIRDMISGNLTAGVDQDDARATYSIWRDENDYWVDWVQDSSYIKRFVDSVGFPYKGACSYMAGKVVRITGAEILPEICIENNSPGKIFELENGCPIVLCGKGLLKITGLTNEEGQELLPLKKLKQRFASE
ncbi:formyltransferase family protein [Bdellovibrio svalbardensis]|uniref:Methionyl-tRNA formyltransferase n=1 Tax=Bdellovibrio svalbardensis TaxID=2972972 RepID=A0ABT6DML8_9BACT|nr:formyltransferase family protein [Bdellovibrio svalbardensis]MDG0817340.1 hypothetical protein [Bdellovibrio svalbardensis]